ncbi:MAG: CoA-binding protein [Candidatus Eisenbacteria bacterium]|uniref:CoA-binding protein n=1 Tax=Eiseniibacteriota bacterium TaxID=2212470 RepID=A0A538TQZ6_UNCEI|nr:MAG: CoA-binding protein [Candidatus Eisenbacteria bacterium]
MLSPLIVESEEELKSIVRSAKTVAVVGIKDGTDPDAPAYHIPMILQSRGIRIFPVNPKFQTVLGERVYPDLASVPERVDIIDIFRRPDAIPALADEILALPPEKRPAVVWMQSGIKNDAAAQTLAEAGIRVVQDHCLGVYSARYRLPAPETTPRKS